MGLETVFTMDMSSIKFGPGVTREVGEDLKSMGVRRPLLITDGNLGAGQIVGGVLDVLTKGGLDFHFYDQVRVEPTDESFQHAIRFAVEREVDGFLAVGGGSTIDTAKAANLYATYPADFLEYVNPPIGKGTPVPGPLKPLVAVPTTAGTGSETTGVAIFDLVSMHAKTGIAHRALRPSLGVVDPQNTKSLSPMAAACTGLDVLSHAVESFTALPYSLRSAPDHPGMRPAYQGANPISDLWALRALKMVADNIVCAITDPDNDEARGQMMLAATYAGIGFGNAGVHLPHGMSYPVSSMVREFISDGYVSDHPIIPHGMSVILNAPAVFRFTAPTSPSLHLRAASALGADIANAEDGDAGDALAGAIVDLMRRTEMPNGLSAVGFSPYDVDALVAGTLPQHRVTKLSPRPAGEEDLRKLFLDSMVCW